MHSSNTFITRLGLYITMYGSMSTPVFGVTMSWIVTADAYCCMPAAAAQNAYLKYGLAYAQRPAQPH